LFERIPKAVKILNELGLPDLAMRVSKLLTKTYQCDAMHVIQESTQYVEEA
jgi:hypothetical protein